MSNPERLGTKITKATKRSWESPSRASRASCPGGSNARQLVPELFFLGLEIPPREFRRRDLERQRLDDRQAVALEAHELPRVVCEEPHRPHAERAQNLRADAVVALVGLEAELLVRLDGV